MEAELPLGHDQWAERYCPFWHYKRKENNIFALASTLFILQELAPYLRPHENEIVQKISAAIHQQYPRFRNKDGRATYNFYTTRPSGHFPNGWFMQYLDHFRLPDDIDDTALITYTLQPPVSEVGALRDLTDAFAENLPSGKRVYGTWYGKHMPKEQDVCALLNLLYLFSAYALKPSPTDVDTFDFLLEQAKFILTKPFEIARHYATPALILYHYSRYMGRFSSPLDALRPSLVTMANSLLHHERIFMNRLILETSLLKLGETRPPLSFTHANTQNFHTFIGAPFAPFAHPIAKRLAALPAFQIFWRSTLHEKALMAEYLVVSQLKSGISSLN